MKKRYPILDEIRGITLCSMMIYHAVWDLVYMFGVDWKWYHTDFSYIWQQSICWCFILLSGFCFSMGRKKWKRGLVVFGAGALVSLVTGLVMPKQRVLFGVLTLLGTSMLVMAAVEAVIEKYKEQSDKKRDFSNSKWGMIISMILFVLTKRINDGYLGFADIHIISLPKGWYQKGNLGTFFGFTEQTFYSTDYFSFLPWFFLFLTGYFLYGLFVEKDWLSGFGNLPSMGKIWRFLGRHSLIIYLLHQPIIYVVLALVFQML